MPGVRIQHPTERNALYTLVDGSRPYTAPVVCVPPPLGGGCGRTHLFKTYHLRLDETGAAIVSEQIAERLKRLHGHGFVIGDEVANPPTQIIRYGNNEPVRVVADPLLTEPV